MKTLVVSLALLGSAAISAPAFAQDNAWYVGVDGGALFGHSYSNGGATLKPRTGYDLDAVVGYDFGHFRAEGEFGYKRASLGHGAVCSIVDTVRVCDSGSVSGNVHALSGMANLLLDLGSPHGINFSLGGGAGVARIGGDVGGDGLGSTTKFAWQGLAEVRMPVADQLDVGLKYRYFRVNSAFPSLDSTGRKAWTSNSVLASLTYRFGEPAAAPAAGQ